jgi:hypothetical protein
MAKTVFGYRFPDYLFSPQDVTNKPVLGNGAVRGVDYPKSGAGIKSPKVERHCFPIFGRTEELLAVWLQSGQVQATVEFNKLFGLGRYLFDEAAIVSATLLAKRAKSA